MYVVRTPNGFAFVCDEYEDAVSLADSVAADIGEDTTVVDETTLEVVYIAYA